MCYSALNVWFICVNHVCTFADSVMFVLFHDFYEQSKHFLNAVCIIVKAQMAAIMKGVPFKVRYI